MLLDRMKNADMAGDACTEALNEYDRKLIENITSIIRANFDNSEFNMNDLAAQLGMGRSKLYTRMKEVTGLTPNEFALKLKMSESMKLLNGSPHLTIAEISYMLGFSSARYFSQSFKSFYGTAPANIRKQTHENG
jgi:AraC-like DNA-binding protein